VSLRSSSWARMASASSCSIRWIAPAEQMPVQMENSLTGARPDGTEHAVVLEAERPCRIGDELEHAKRLLGRELADLAEGVDMPLGHDQDVHLGLGVDVLHGDETVGLADGGTRVHELAEEAVVLGHGRLAIPIIPRSVTCSALTRTISPTGPSTSHGV